ncbi:MAG: LCP family protein [Actinomycetota bacterium]
MQQFEAPAPPVPPVSGHRRRVRSSAPIGVLLAVAVGAAGALGLVSAADRQVADVTRIENLEEVLVAVDGPAVNYLLIGSDSRDGADPTSSDFGAIGDTSDVSGRRSDTIMVLRQERDGEGAALLSFPRDLWLTHADTGQEQRINATYNRGADVLAATITQNYDIPINHVVDIDFFGFKDLVEAIGGTTLCFDVATRDVNSGLNQQPGCNLLDGDQALAYARARNYEEFRDGQWRKDPTADIGRVTRQQSFISATVDQTLTKLRADPFLASELIDATTDSLALDPNLDPLGAAGTLRKAFGSGFTTYQLPVDGANINGNSVLLLRDAEAQPILDYFRGVGPLPAPPVEGLTVEG